MTEKIKSKLMDRKGFTLIELIVVIAIIAILAAVLIPRFTGFTQDANQKSAVSDARNILLAVEALNAESDFTVSVEEITKYTGKTFPGTISLVDGTAVTATGTSGNLTGASFWYTKDSKYRVYVNDGSIDTTFTEITGAPPALNFTVATGSHFIK